jgi:hypothetical protein
MRSMSAAMRLYHRTTRANALLILRDGFVDRRDRYTSDFGSQGVWFSDLPKDADEDDSDDAVMSVDFGFAAKALAVFEWIEDKTTYREWLIPTALVNSSMTRTRIC